MLQGARYRVGEWEHAKQRAWRAIRDCTRARACTCFLDTIVRRALIICIGQKSVCGKFAITVTPNCQAQMVGAWSNLCNPSGSHLDLHLVVGMLLAVTYCLDNVIDEQPRVVLFFGCGTFKATTTDQVTVRCHGRRKNRQNRWEWMVGVVCESERKREREREMDGRVDKWIDEWVGGWMDGWAERPTSFGGGLKRRNGKQRTENSCYR